MPAVHCLPRTNSLAPAQSEIVGCPAEVATPVASSAPWPETVEELERVVAAQEGEPQAAGAAASSAEPAPEPAAAEAAAASSAETQQQEDRAPIDVLQGSEVTEVSSLPCCLMGTDVDCTGAGKLASETTSAGHISIAAH